MDRDAGLEVLAGRGWLSQADRGFATGLLGLARWRSFAPGEVLTLGGEERGTLFALADGVVALTSSLGQAETPVMHMAPAVMWLGYGPALLVRDRVVTAEARTPCWAASFPGSRVRAMVDEGRLDWRPFMRLMAEYGDISSLIAADLLIRDSGARCAAVLARFAGLRTPLAGAMPRTLVPVTQEELAGACNLSRGVAGDILRRMASEGVIATCYGGIEIRDPAALLRLARGGAAPPRDL